MSNVNPNEYFERYGVDPALQAPAQMPVQPHPQMQPQAQPQMPPPKPQAAKKSKVSRRRFIQGALATGAIAVGGGVYYRYQNGSGTIGQGQLTSQPGLVGGDPTGELRSDAVNDRVLVVVELTGGNDGLSMVVPYTSGTYYDLRPNTAIPQEEVLVLDDQFGLHPNLTRLHERGITYVAGVGSTFNNLSHFTSEAYWQEGDSTGNASYRSGFLARCIDPLDTGSPVTGLATNGFTPYFNSSKAQAVAMNNVNYLNYLTQNEEDRVKTTFQNAITDFGAPQENSHFGLVNTAYGQLLDLGEIAGQSSEEENPITEMMLADGGSLGRQLNFAADMISSGAGVRVIHAQLGGFDTHNGQRGRHDNLMAQLDAAIGGFFERGDQEGFSDRTLVAVYSEFGRRIAENNDRGTDHGQGSNTFLVGPIAKGKIGDLNVADIDDNGNLKTTVPFDSIQRSCAEWLGIKGDSIFTESQTEIIF